MTGGASLLHDFTPRLTLGAEVYAAVADSDQLNRKLLQGLVGAEYTVRKGLGVAVAVLGGRYSASPRFGVQIGFQMDIPQVFRSANPSKSFTRDSVLGPWRNAGQPGIEATQR